MRQTSNRKQAQATQRGPTNSGRVWTEHGTEDTSSSEEAEEQAESQASLRLKHVLDVFKTRERTTPKQLAQVLGIKGNTATEHLRRIETLGHVRRVSRGLYEVFSQA